MIRKIVVLLGVFAVVAMTALPAAAMCRPGRVGVDPRTGKVTVELPRCDPPPQ